MTQRDLPLGGEDRPSLATRLESLAIIPNLLFGALVILVLISMQGGSRVAPLVEGDRGTTTRIAQLERDLRHRPHNVQDAIELARLYQQVGEFPWSYDALLDAERSGSDEPQWRMMLGLAYLELGKNDDAVRVLHQTHAGCKRQPTLCDSNQRTRLRIFLTLARMFKNRGIDSRKHHEAAQKALQELLKPVHADPEKMRPKAPAAPASSASTRQKG